MNEQRYRSTAGPALASMDNWNAQQNRRPVMLTDSERAAVEPDPGLDELLDSVHPEATVSLHYVSMPMADDPDPYWRAQVRVPLAGFVGNHMYEATGPTRMAAIQDAVRQANATDAGPCRSR